jgi:molybdate transport system substrate-binding protein
VFAAASLGGPLAQIASLFEQRTGIPVTVVHASSSTLARQIEHGAPAAVFVSANRQWMDHLGTAGLLVDDTLFDWLGNRLVVVGPAGEPPAPDLVAALGAGRIAIGDPAHVPAGMYARESMQRLGLWARVAPRSVRADNVRAALVLVARREVARGIVYATDARLEPGVSVLRALPPDTHAAILYPAAAVRPEHPAARAFLAFLRSPASAGVVRAAGFAPAGGRWALLQPAAVAP